VVERSSDSTTVDVEGTFTIEGSNSANYTYLAVLIKDDAYSLDIRAESNGTSASTNFSVNDAQVVQSWRIGGVGQKNINATTVQNWVKEAFKDDPISITLLKNNNSIEFTLLIDDDFGDGDYYLNVGAWNNSNSSQRLVAFEQSKIKINTAPPTQPDTGRRGGGGGGGGGGVSVPPPLQAGSAVLYTSFHTFRDTESIINIPSTYASDTGVTRLKGKTDSSIFVSFAVSGVSELPSNIPQPDSDVYRTFEIVFTEFNTVNEVEPSGTIEFKVSKDWIDENGYDPEDIVLLKFKEGWQELQTELVDEDEDYYYYEATVDSFSIFAISSPMRTSISPPPTQPTTPTPQPEPTTTEPPETPEPETTPDEGSFWSNNVPLVIIIINAVVIGIVALIIYFKRI
ncbi:MAG: PGF-pre-PGF domain-containing protein, partial [Archaeoglobaceae archaeon]